MVVTLPCLYCHVDRINFPVLYFYYIFLSKPVTKVITDGDDEAQLSRGVYDTYTGTNLRYSQVAPLSMFDEVWE
jgi:hypothetical protein